MDFLKNILALFELKQQWKCVAECAEASVPILTTSNLEGSRFESPEVSSPKLNLWIPEFNKAFPRFGLADEVGWTKKYKNPRCFVVLCSLPLRQRIVSQMEKKVF